MGFRSTDIVCWASELYEQNDDFQFSIDQIVPQPEPKNIDARSRRPKFEFRLHSPAPN